jgi:hypothetical protein
MENKADKINELLIDIKKLLILGLTDKGIQGKRIAEVLDVDPAVISRILSPKSSKKK